MGGLTIWAATLAGFAAGALFGGAVVYWFLTGIASRNQAGEPMADQSPERTKLAVALIGMAAILVVFGLQVRDDQRRDDDYRRQAEAFQEQQACLNQGARAVNQYLVTTLNTRVQANNRLDRAQKTLTEAGGRLAAANTRVVLVVAGLADVPPTATEREFLDALANFRVAARELNTATRAFNKVERATKDTLDGTGTPEKPYDPPTVDCVP